MASATRRARARIPGLHDRAPLRLVFERAAGDDSAVFPVFMTGLH